MKTKYHGIDSRDIKCCSENENSIEAGISIEDDGDIKMLHFFYLDYLGDTKILSQRRKIMHLNKETTQQLITALQELNFD